MNHSQQAAAAFLVTYEYCSTARRETTYMLSKYFARCVECSKSELFDLPNTYPLYLS
jgi:hypothetical protein